MNTQEFDALLESDDILLEYSGNAKKNAEFKEILKTLDDFIDVRLECIKRTEDELNKQYNLLKNCKSTEDIKKSNTKFIQHTREYNDWYKKNSDKNDEFIGKFERFTELAKSFTVKYSDDIMKEKEVLYKKIKEAKDKIVKIVEPWGKDGDSFKKMDDAISNVLSIDEVYGKTVMSRAQETTDFLIKITNTTLITLGSSAATFRIREKDSLVYKFVNAVFKESCTTEEFENLFLE